MAFPVVSVYLWKNPLVQYPRIPGHEISAVIEKVGNPITYKAAIEEVAFAGRAVCIGYAGVEVAFHTKLWVQKELEIMGSRNANLTDFEAVMKFLKSCELDTSLLITKTVDPSGAAQAIKEWSETPGKVMKILVTF